jgi:hypothetical protein
MWWKDPPLVFSYVLLTVHLDESRTTRIMRTWRLVLSRI